MTIREFAKLCGVSPATASRFFSGQGNISTPVRKRIEEVAKQTKYVPPAGYRSRRKCSDTIVVVMPDFAHSFFLDALREILASAQQQDKRVAILTQDNEQSQNTLEHIRTLSPQGVVLMSESQNDPVAEALAEWTMPTVVCGATNMGRRLSTVHIDDLLAAYDGMHYLLSLGHTQIGILSDDAHTISSGFQRLTGCKKAIEDAAQALPDSHIVYGQTTYDAGYTGMEQLLKQAPHISAIFAFSDDLAAGAMAYMHDQGIRVPEDISVLGFDDTTIGQQLRPGLTTIHQPLDQLARCSLRRLIHSEGAHDITSITLSYQLIERETCKRYIPKP